MTALVISPFAFIPDLDGSALDDGNIYVGLANQNPLIEANRVAIYSDLALTIPIAQPVRTDNGTPVVTSNPVRIFTATSPYSIVITDRHGLMVYTNLNVQDTLTQILSTIIKYDLTPEEIAAGVTPVAFYYEPLDPRRYATVADWSLVYNQINTLAKSYYGWYRGDRAQHIQLTNAIVGFGAYNDAQMTGTIGYRCTAFGALSLSLNNLSTLAGGSNTAIGYGAQQDSVDTSGNTSVGTKTLAVCTGVNSAHNGAFGNSTLEALSAGTQNNAFAYRAMYQLQVGNNNDAFGDVCLQGLLRGTANQVFGHQGCFTKPAGLYTHGFGHQVLFNENSSVITAITKAATAVVTISTVSAIHPFTVGQPVIINDVVGMVEINELITGIVTAVGGISGAWTVTVSINSTGFSNYVSGGYLSPYGNSAFGSRAGFNVSRRGGNTIFGCDAMQTAEPGYGNTVMGHEAGLLINTNGGGDRGDLNSIFGFWAGRGLTTGASNAFFGQRAGIAVTTGSENVVVGPNSGVSITTAQKNVAVGSITTTNLNGNNNTAVGYNAGSTAAPQTYSNVTSLGANSVPNGSNQVNLGDGAVANIRAQVTVITAYSDERLKKNIAALEIPDEAMEDLPIAVFEWLADEKPKGIQMGVIAQRLNEWQIKWGLEWMELVIKNDHDFWEATPHKLIFPLLEHTKRLSKQVRDHESRLIALENRQ